MSSDGPVDREPGPPSEPGFLSGGERFDGGGSRTDAGACREAGVPEAVSISTQHLARMRAHAVEEMPAEACGILVGVVGPRAVRVTRVLPCRNSASAESRGTRFEIDPRIVLNLRRALRGSADAIVGFFHSHPNGAPGLSPHDLEYARWWPSTVWLVLPVSSGAVVGEAAWWLDTPESAARRLEVVPHGGGSAVCTE